MKRNVFVLRAASGLAASALASGTARAQSPGPAIRVGIPQSQDVVQILYAVKAGLFAKAGLNVELVPLVNGAAISAAVAGGSLEFGMSSLQGLISGHVHGLPFLLLAPAGLYSSADPYAYMFVRKDAAVAVARDLNGKILASPALKDLDWIANASWMEQNGGDFKSAKPVEMPNPNLLPALLEGRIDAYTVGEPWSTIAQESGKVKILARSFEAIAPRFLMTGWFAKSDYIDRNREVVDRFERVIRDATLYANTHKAEMIPIVATYLKLDPALVAKTMKGATGAYLDPSLVQPMIEASAKYGLIERPFNATDLISPTALKPPR